MVTGYIWIDMVKETCSLNLKKPPNLFKPNFPSMCNEGNSVGLIQLVW
jgi:hypothetical protein